MERSTKDYQTLKEENQSREKELRAQLTQVGVHMYKNTLIQEVQFDVTHFWFSLIFYFVFLFFYCITFTVYQSLNKASYFGFCVFCVTPQMALVSHFFFSFVFIFFFFFMYHLTPPFCGPIHLPYTTHWIYRVYTEFRLHVVFLNHLFIWL